MAESKTESRNHIAEEYRALREAAAVVDLAHWTVLGIAGPDTREFLQGTATQDFSTAATPTAATPAAAPPGAATPGAARETLFLTDKGRPVALAWVSVASDGASAIVIADEGARAGLRPHLEHFRIMEEVEIAGPDSGVMRLLGVAGPERDPLARAVAASVPGARTLAASPLSFVLVSANAPTVSLPPSVDAASFQAWRLHVGLPLMGYDMDLDRIATELSLPEAISLTKGCYVGQEVVARTTARGHVRRQRIGFRFPWDGVGFTKGTELRSGGASAGHVTSTAAEPGTGDGLGMGYLAPNALAEDLSILAVQGAKTTHLRLHSWPL